VNADEVDHFGVWIFSRWGRGYPGRLIVGPDRLTLEHREFVVLHRRVWSEPVEAVVGYALRQVPVIPRLVHLYAMRLQTSDGWSPEFRFNTREDEVLAQKALLDRAIVPLPDQDDIRRFNPAAFYVPLVARNHRDEALETPAIAALVDEESDGSWLPRELLIAAGIREDKHLTIRRPSGEVLSRDAGFAILRAEGFETADEVIFAEAGDQPRLGRRTLNGFGVVPDYEFRQLVPRPVRGV
jgi:hypothetical protein